MAQFQIHYSPSTDEWRPVPAEFCLLTRDHRDLWPSFGEAEAARKRIHADFPGVAFRVVQASDESGDIDWQSRERMRFADGTYTQVPWHAEAWYQIRHEEHFCHVSTEQAGKIAFTENAAKGAVDRQLVMSPGRYLQRFFSADLDNNAIEHWCARLSVQLEEDTLKVTQDADEIEDVYVGGPCSCMAHPADDFESLCHPVRVYAGPDTALAYIGARDDARARSIVWPARKVYTTIYGDVSRLKLLLEREGYGEGGLNGARLQRIEHDDCFVVPYIDGGDDLADGGEYLIVGRGTISSESTTGLGLLPWYCCRCEGQARPYDTVHHADGSYEEWCENCFSNHSTYCEHNERSYPENEDFVIVYAHGAEHTVLEAGAANFGAVYLEDRSEWWMRDCCRECDATGDVFRSDDLYEYQGEWLCEGCLPEPLDDDDPLQANAHVHDYQCFLGAPPSRLADHACGSKHGADDCAELDTERADPGAGSLVCPMDRQQPITDEPDDIQLSSGMTACAAAAHSSNAGA
ncbi:hypothetical protein [Novosphingobium sp.]|uniref:hypothetical protein n=1 Tax=Novosphingobium sp. TaxID=1874826 RepID=UPI002FE293C3